MTPGQFRTSLPLEVLPRVPADRQNSCLAVPVSGVGLALGVRYSSGPADQIPYGEGRAFAVGDHQVAVFRKRDGACAPCPQARTRAELADGQIDKKVVFCRSIERF